MFSLRVINLYAVTLIALSTIAALALTASPAGAVRPLVVEPASLEDDDEIEYVRYVARGTIDLFVSYVPDDDCYQYVRTGGPVALCQLAPPHVRLGDRCGEITFSFVVAKRRGFGTSWFAWWVGPEISVALTQAFIDAGRKISLINVDAREVIGTAPPTVTPRPWQKTFDPAVASYTTPPGFSTAYGGVRAGRAAEWWTSIGGYAAGTPYSVVSVGGSPPGSHTYLTLDSGTGAICSQKSPPAAISISWPGGIAFP